MALKPPHSIKYSGGISVLSHKPQGLKTFIPKSGDLVPSVFVPGAVPTQRWGTFARATRTRSSWGSSTTLFHEPQRSSVEPSNQATKKSNSRVRLPPPGESCPFFAMMLASKKNTNARSLACRCGHVIKISCFPGEARWEGSLWLICGVNRCALMCLRSPRIKHERKSPNI